MFWCHTSDPLYQDPLFHRFSFHPLETRSFLFSILLWFYHNHLHIISCYSFTHRLPFSFHRRRGPDGKKTWHDNPWVDRKRLCYTQLISMMDKLTLHHQHILSSSPFMSYSISLPCLLSPSRIPFILISIKKRKVKVIRTCRFFFCHQPRISSSAASSLLLSSSSSSERDDSHADQHDHEDRRRHHHKNNSTLPLLFFRQH